MKLLHSTIIGNGQPFIILHGYFGMSDNWKSLGIQFAENFEVHLVDQRNHGRSFHTDEFDYELLVEDLYNYINHYKLNKVVLLGHSMGGKVAMLFATTYPEIVDKLIVADISPKFYKPHHQQILAALNAVNFSIHNSRQKVEEILRIYIKEEEILQFMLKNLYWESKGKLAFRFNLTSLTENNSEVGEALASFSYFDEKTLFLKGENSNYIIKEDEPLIKTHFSNSIIETIKKAGHWLHAENPTQFHKKVLSFLSNK
ncbi:alpha/beta fold hydrolase [Lutibacter sp.]|uniref:alpha/beta fold hydrolase n=1 Tax=Lutibacter sp. TaxID=1925666 RepID=UPI0027375DB6|nr:alpha/beta fold hydrolase [Lutibacter sp.]MDP3312035.1 alpha/beta fold hydrolase [Lutibacter sp.]